MTKFERQRRSLLIAILVVSLLLAAVSSVGYAKYIYAKPLSGTVTISADIGTIHLLEHQAIKQLDGSYELSKEATVETNSYTLIPGQDVPKDPYVVVNKKNTLPVYIYVQVDSKLNESAVGYSMDEYDEISNPDGNWLHLQDNVYVYCGGTANALQVTDSIDKIEILENNLVTVGQKLKKGTTTDLGLNFYAAMHQAIPDKDAAEVYQYFNAASYS